MSHSDGETLQHDEEDATEDDFSFLGDGCVLSKAKPGSHASRERLKEETRLVVLDFLASLPPEKLTARNLSTSDPKPAVLRKARNRVKISASDAAAYEKRRVKFQKRSATLRRKLSQNLKRDIENFDPARLRRRESFKYKDAVSSFLAAFSNNWIGDEEADDYVEVETENQLLYAQDHVNDLRAEGAVVKDKFLKRPKNLDIPPSPGGICSLSSPVLSPEGRVAAKLEQISQEIMADFPHLLDKPLETIKSGNFTYEQFALAAKQAIFDYQDVGWSKVALLCYFAREVAIGGGLDDKQLDLLADYSLRFIQESTTAEWIDKQGGWAALELEEGIVNKATLISKYKEQEEKDGMSPDKRRSLNNKNNNTWNAWMKYGVALLAVGVGVCYSLTRH